MTAQHFALVKRNYLASPPLLSWLMIAIMAMPLRAQDDPEKSYAARDTVTIIAERIAKVPTTSTVAAKMNLPLQRTPASVGVVSSAIYENQGSVVLGEALRNISGAQMQTQFGIHDYFMIRGFDSVTSGLVLTDGAAEPEATFYNLYNVDHIEVLKGPGAFVYGASPLSGTVNLVRKQPLFQNFLYAAGAFGSFESYRGVVDIGAASLHSGLAFRLNSLFRRSDNYRDAKKSENYAVNPALTWHPASNVTLNFNIEYVDSKHHPDAGLPLVNNALPSVPRTQSYQSPYDFSDQKVWRGRLDFEYRFESGLLLRNKSYYTELDWQSDGTLLFGVRPAQSGELVVDRALSSLDDRQRLGGNQLELVARFNTGNIRHQLLTGFEASRLRDNYKLGNGLLPPIALVAPQEFAMQRQVFPYTESNASRWTYAPYIIDHVSLSDKIDVMIGGRYDLIDYHDDQVNYLVGTSIIALPDTIDRDDKDFSPIAGLTYSPTSAWSLYANYGKAFAPPSTQARGDDLKPERTEQFEAGLKTNALNGKLTGSLATYQLTKTDLAISDFAGFTTNTGEQRSRGIEVELILQPERNWQAFLSYAYTKAELTSFVETVLVPTPDGQFVPQQIDRSGNTAAFAPEHILNLWTNKEFENGLGIGAGLSYISKQFIDEDNAFQMDGYITLDAMAYYSLGQCRFYLNLKNLTGTAYETRGFGNASVIPAQKFAAMGSFEFKL